MSARRTRSTGQSRQQIAVKLRGRRAREETLIIQVADAFAHRCAAESEVADASDALAKTLGQLEELGFALPQIYRRQVGQMARLYREGKSAELRDFELSSRSNRNEVEPASKLFRNVDGIKFLRHESGCGCTREDGRNLAGIFAGCIHNPNVAGATISPAGG